MTEKITLQQVLSEAIHAYCSQDGFGIPVGFIYCVSRIAENGQQVLTLGCNEEQPTHMSLGMAAYLTKNFEMDAEHELTSYFMAIDEDED